MKNIKPDLFDEDSYFADVGAFWTAQNAAIDARRDAYLEAGWSDVIIVPPSEHFRSYEFASAPKDKGGRVYIDVRANGEVEFHEPQPTGPGAVVALPAPKKPKRRKPAASQPEREAA